MRCTNTMVLPSLLVSPLGGWPDWSPTARNFLTRPPTGTPRRVVSPGEGLPTSPYLPQREWPRLPVTARIERAHSYRARSASKKGTWPLPLLPPQRPPMPISIQQRIRLSRPPASSAIEVNGIFSSQQRIIEAPSRFSEIRADEEGLVADHHVAE